MVDIYSKSGLDKNRNHMVNSRKLAASVLTRVFKNNSYAEIVLDNVFAKNTLTDKDQRFIAELVYGTIRWKHLILKIGGKNGGQNNFKKSTRQKDEYSGGSGISQTCSWIELQTKWFAGHAVSKNWP